MCELLLPVVLCNRVCVIKSIFREFEEIGCCSFKFFHWIDAPDYRTQLLFITHARIQPFLSLWSGAETVLLIIIKNYTPRAHILLSDAVQTIDVSMVSIDVDGCLWVFVGGWVSVSVYACLWIFIGVNGCQSVSIDFQGNFDNKGGNTL